MTFRRSLLRPPALHRRPGLYLSVAAAGAVAVHVLVAAGPPAEAEGGTSVSVARQLGLTARSGHARAPGDLRSLEELAASRADRAAAQTAAQSAKEAGRPLHPTRVVPTDQASHRRSPRARQTTTRGRADRAGRRSAGG